MPLREADFCYNDHYSVICRDDQLLLITEKVTLKEGYRKELEVKWERRVQAKEMGFRIESQSEMEIDEEVRERTIHRGETRCDLCQRF